MSLVPSSSRSGWPSQWTADANGNTTFAPTQALHNGWLVIQAPAGSKANETDAIYLKDEDGNLVGLFACDGGMLFAENASSTDGYNFRIGTQSQGFGIQTSTLATVIRVTSAGAMGFFDAVPAARPAAIPNASAGVVIDAEARTAVNALLAATRTLGLIAT